MANFKVSNYYKKTVEEHEHYVKDDMTIIRKVGYRSGSFFVETNDDNPPEFVFDFVPGGDGNKDSINMYNCIDKNIENVELDSLWDGCWEDIEFPEDMDEEEKDRLMELIDEEGIYEALEEQEGWSLDETEVWVWGPILIEGENDNQIRIIIADENGNVTDFKEDE